MILIKHVDAESRITADQKLQVSRKLLIRFFLPKDQLFIDKDLSDGTQF